MSALDASATMAVSSSGLGSSTFSTIATSSFLRRHDGLGRWLRASGAPRVCKLVQLPRRQDTSVMRNIAAMVHTNNFDINM